ncbi:MAG: tetratricopeptide repeat protein [Halioglobus sp.]
MHSVLPQVNTRLLRSLVIAALSAIAACTTTAPPPQAIAPLVLPDRTVQLADVPFLAPRQDLLAMDEEMEAFVQRYTGNLASRRQRLTQLHRSMRSSALLDLEYEPGAEGSAREAYHRGTVNCLSYAHLMVAMAREAGLNARYQWVDVRPTWSRMGERVAVRLHVNVLIKTRVGDEYMADIDPLQPADITGTHLLSDTDAEALYHSNIAMAELAREQLPSAWAHAVRAVQLSPKMSHLRVNLGAVYRHSGQHAEAEQSYLYALQLDGRDRSAMNNLMVLYGMDGREEEHVYWQQRIERYRQSNPYYYAWHGDKAGEAGDWDGALAYYQQALALASGDSNLLYTTGLIHYQLQQYEEASRFIIEAIEHASLRREIDSYQAQLDRVKREQVRG